MKICEFDKRYEEDVRDLYVELQEYINKLDKYGLNYTAPDYRQKYFDAALEDCEKRQGKIFIAVENDRAVGCGAGWVQEFDDFDRLNYRCPKKAIIGDLIVAQNYRGKHVGENLVKAIENAYKANGCEYIQLDVFAYNESAKKFYAKLGFEERMVTLLKKF